MEVTSKASEVVVVVGEEGDVELSLGLSLGGRSTGNKTMSPTVNGGILSNGTGDFDGVIAGEINSFVKSGVVSAEGVREKMDLVRKRETCSPQRHRKKREERRQKVAENKVSDYRVESNYKPNPNHNPNHNPNPNPKPNDDMNPKQSPDLETKSSNTSTAATGVNQNHGLPPYGAFPMMPMQYPLTQCIPYPFPYVVPWLNMNPNIPVSSGKDVAAASRNVFQPVPSRSFLPFHEQQVANGTASFRGEEVNGGGINRTHSLTASQGSSFSTVSEYQSASIQGGSSSSNDTRTDSTNHAPREKTQLSSFSKLDELSQKSSLNYSPNQSEALGQVNVEQTGNELISNSKKSTPSSNTMPEAVPELKSDEATPPAKKHILTNNQAKPISSALPEMPCVSTTGDGPNGKKITGLLYRYSKTEVSIVCVCHGTFFSPAEFIKHAGGREVSHPLRHIIVVPS